MVKISFKLLSIFATASLVRSAHIYSCTKKNVVALTFDDGPTEYTNQLIETLNKNNIKATFFVNAHNYSPYADENKSQRDLIKKAYDSGHQIASHTYNHFLPMDLSEMKESTRKMDKFLKSIIGVTPRYFRAPGGNCEESCVKNLENLGYRVIKWDVDTLDWKTGSSGAIPKLKEFFNQKKSNYLVLMHDSVETTIKETVPWIIKSGISKNYKFVTVAECLGDSKKYREGSGSSPEEDKTSKTSATTTTDKEVVPTNAAVPVDVSNPMVNGNATTIIPGGEADLGNNLNNGNIDTNAPVAQNLNNNAQDENSGSLHIFNQSIAMLIISTIVVIFNNII